MNVSYTNACVLDASVLDGFNANASITHQSGLNVTEMNASPTKAQPPQVDASVVNAFYTNASVLDASVLDGFNANAFITRQSGLNVTEMAFQPTELANPEALSAKGRPTAGEQVSHKPERGWHLNRSQLSLIRENHRLD